MIRKQFDELKSSGRLPSPSGIGLKIMRMTQTDSWDITDLVAVVSADPALTSRIIKLANSAQEVGLAAIATLQDAAVRVGARNVSNQALSFSLVSGNRSGRCEEFEYDRFWSLSLATGVAAGQISKKASLAAPTEAFTCALLSKVGQLGLASVHPATYSELLVAANEDSSVDIASLENERFAINSREVTAALMEDWGMPEYFYESVSYQKRSVAGDETTNKKTIELVLTLRMAAVLGEFCLADEEAQVELWPAVARVREDLGLDSDEFQEFCESVAEEWKEWGANLNFSTTDCAELKDIERLAGGFEPHDAESIMVDGEIDPDKFRALRILAVDDEPVSLRVLAGQLKIAGHEVLMARDGEEALAMTLEHNPHIVISDWMMPKMDGLELCKALRRAQAGRSVYFLLLTGRDEEDRVVEAFEGGIDDYVAKPFNSKILLARVRAGLRLVNLREQVDLEQITQREKTAELGVLTRQLREAAFTDALTNLPNRRFCMESLETEWECWVKSKQELSVITLDIDFFKAVNDNHGHDVGDDVLCETSDAMKKVLRDGDMLARIGGEEFLVICPETNTEGALICAERIRVAIEEHVIESGGFKGNVTISSGVSTASEGMEDAYALIKASDEALYLAKGDGRNCVRTAPPRDLQLPRSA